MKRLIGILFTLVALAAITFASLNFGNYKSMVFKPRKTLVPNEIVAPLDSLGVSDSQTIEQIDSLVVEKVAETETGDAAMQQKTE